MGFLDNAKQESSYSVASGRDLNYRNWFWKSGEIRGSH